MTKIKNNLLSLLLSVAMGAVIILLGNPAFFGKNVEPYVEVSNDYFIQDEILELSELFHSEGKDVPRVLYGDLILFYRQYDPSVFSIADREDYEYVTKHTQEKFQKHTDYGEDMKRIIETYFYGDFRIEGSLFQKSLKELKVDYVVSGSVHFDTYMKSTDLKVLGKTENYTVWKMP